MILLPILVAAASASVAPAPAIAPDLPLMRMDFVLADPAPPPAATPEPRVEPLVPVETGPVANPFAVSLLDEDDQQLRIGVGPGGRAKLGMAYRLSLGN